MLAADSKAVPAAGQAVHSWKQIIDPVEPFLDAVSQRLAQEVKSFDAELLPYAEYALTGQGKHLRPALVALTAEALGKPTEAHVTAAVIIEMIHLATLVHDDVMDEAEIRRGRLTLAANWGNEIAVLFGDCLFAQALKLASGFPTTDVCRAVSVATNTVCSGEILQTQHRRDFRFTQDHYFRVLEMKTAELFAVSCELSAFLSGVSLEQIQALRRFGVAFGTAYQIYDDCVDLFGSENVAGKSLGTDLAKGKLTLPVLLAWDLCDPADRAKLENLVQNWNPVSMKAMAELLSKYDALGESMKIMRQYLDKARQALRPLPPSAGLDGLAGLTDYLARQTDALGCEPESSL
jgi:octaprenyl-diphosphate synthase